VDAQTLSDTVVFSLITALVLVIAVAVVYYFYRSRQRSTSLAHQQKLGLEERFRNAVWSSAVVIASTSMAAAESGREKVRVSLELEVETPEGRRYPVKTTWWVDPGYLGMLRPGESVLIRIDQQDAMRVYPNVDWAQPLEWDQE
jgi:uncharacterized membrane protein